MIAYMQPFKDIARKNFSEKFQGNRMLGTLALNTIKKYFDIADPAESIVRDKEILSGFLKYEVLFLRTQDQELKIAIFKEKNKIIEKINNQFQNLGYTQKISEIRFTN